MYYVPRKVIFSILLLTSNLYSHEEPRTITVHGNFNVLNEWDQSLAFLFNDEERGRIIPNYTDGEHGMAFSIDKGSTHSLRINNNGTITIPNSLIVGYNTLVADPVNNKVNINNPEATPESLNVNGGATFSRNLTAGNNTLFVNADWQRVGINTNNATATLTVNGDADIAQNLRFNTATTALSAVGSAEYKPLIVRGTVDTSYGGAYGQYVYGFTSALGETPGQVVITFDTPFNQYETPAVCVTCEYSNNVIYIGVVKNVTSTGFTLETYDLRSIPVGCVAHFIVVGSLQ